MMNVALEVKDLVKTFSLDGTTINAVDHVSFQVRSGEFLGVPHVITSCWSIFGTGKNEMNESAVPGRLP